MHELLEPLFQPIVDASGVTYAYEALLRFKGRSNDSPQFIVEQWEKSGFISVVDLAMLSSIGTAVKTASWRPRLAVNVSIATIERDGAGYLSELGRLAKHARGLIVELTETAPVNDLGSVIRFARQCRAHGYVVALDDCRPGHTYGTAEFLGSMRPDLVKVDGIFLQDSFSSGHTDPLREMIRVAHSFKARVIAEHISSESLRVFALSLGVNFMQGYAVGMPASLPHRERQPEFLETCSPIL